MGKNKKEHKIMLKNKINILALSWRDIKAPKRGGAEVHTHEMLKRLNKERYKVVHFSPLFKGATQKENIDGVTYLRRGNILTVILWAFIYYKKNSTSIDFVVDQCNTHRFFTKLWVSKDKRIFFIHQLTREIWDINLPFPFNKMGRLMESWMLRLNKKDNTITLSKSTKQELLELGFCAEKIYIIPIGVSETIFTCNKEKLEKQDIPTYIYVGRYARYKGINVSIEALAEVKERYHDARLWICGKKDQHYIDQDIKPLCDRLGISCSEYEVNPEADVVLWGFVSEERKYELMKRAHALLFPSIREGWGIIVTEAGILGTPSIVFDAPGTVDAVNYGKAGYICGDRSSKSVAKKMLDVLENEKEYGEMARKAYEFSEQFKWEKNGVLLEQVLEQIIKKQVRKG